MVGNRANNASCGVITWKVSVVPEAPGDSDVEAAGYVNRFESFPTDTLHEGEAEPAGDVDGIDGSEATSIAGLRWRAGLSVTDLHK